MSRLAALLIAVLAIASGCQTPAPRPTTSPAPERDLHDIDRWQASGRLGVASREGGGSGSFDWQQRGDHAEVQIRGPAGIGSVRMEVEGDPSAPRLRLETSDGQVLESEDAWHELEARLGATVPAGNLRYWMLGIAAPGEHRWLTREAEGTASLEQDGWRIDYQRYAQQPIGARVPMRIEATSGDTRVRIVVNRWRLDAPGQ